MKTSIWDILFIVLLTVILIFLSETDRMEVLIKLPFVTIYVAYGIGRLVGYLAGKKVKEVN